MTDTGAGTGFDTGDIVTHDALVRMVCCVHDGYVHLAGHPDRAVPMDECHLVSSATQAERLQHLQVLAGSSQREHRPQCARERLAAMAESYDGGCC